MSASLFDRVRRLRDETGDTHALGLLRAFLGLLLLRQAVVEVEELRTFGYFGDAFHLPFVPEPLVPSARVYALLLGVEGTLAFAVMLGVRARVALFGCTLIGFYLLLCDRLQFHNNHYALLCFGFLLSFSPCDRTFTIGRKTKRDGPLWAQRLMQLQLSIVYLASGVSKLLDPDWRGGLVLGTRFVRDAHNAIDHGVPRAIVDFVVRPDVAAAISKLAIATELFLAIGLFVPRTRLFALWWGVMFHVAIELTNKVQIFTWLTLSLYALHALPGNRTRKVQYDPSRVGARSMAGVVWSLDWLARFELVERPGRWTVVDRDGAAKQGLAAIALIARCLPISFPIGLPMWLVFGARAERAGALQLANKAIVDMNSS